MTAKTTACIGLAAACLLAIGLGCDLPGLPSPQTVQRQIAETRAQMSSLNVALDQYRETFYTYPPSKPSIVAMCGGGQVGNRHAASGAEAMNFFLRGWYVANGTVVRERGYKVQDLGNLTRTIMPMYTPERDEQQSAGSSQWGFGGAAKGRFFCDKFDYHRPILYFKAASGGGPDPFTEAHNALPLAKWKAPNAKSFSSIVKPDGMTTRSLRFLLWSAGPDGLFGNDDDIFHP